MSMTTEAKAAPPITEQERGILAAAQVYAQAYDRWYLADINDPAKETTHADQLEKDRRAMLSAALKCYQQVEPAEL